MVIKIASLINEHHGVLPSYTKNDLFPMYYLTRTNKVLCPKCANEVLLGNFESEGVVADDIVDVQVNWDNENLMCLSRHKIDTATLEIEEEEEVLEIDEY